MLQFGFEAYDFSLEDFMVVNGKAGFISIMPLSVLEKC
jgi:hypothetical protein